MSRRIPKIEHPPRLISIPQERSKPRTSSIRNRRTDAEQYFDDNLALLLPPPAPVTRVHLVCPLGRDYYVPPDQAANLGRKRGWRVVGPVVIGREEAELAEMRARDVGYPDRPKQRWDYLRMTARTPSIPKPDAPLPSGVPMNFGGAAEPTDPEKT